MIFENSVLQILQVIDIAIVPVESIYAICLAASIILVHIIRCYYHKFTNLFNKNFERQQVNKHNRRHR